MRRSAEIAFAATLAVVFAWAAYESRDWADNVKTLPLAVALPGLVLAVVQVVLTARAAAVPDARAADEALPAEERLRRTREIVSWVLGIFAAVYLLGFLVAVPLGALAYLRVSAREGWVPSVAVAALCWAFVYGVFDRVLHVPLPPGELLRQLGLG